MDFTEIYKQSAGLVSFSPGAHFILTAVQDRVLVRKADSLQIARTWLISSDTPSTQPPSGAKNVSSSSGSPADGWITHAGWSCDSEYILAACAKKGTVGVLKLRDESWTSQIDCGAEGLVKAEWAPDGRAIVCFSAWALRVTVWSLITGSSVHIQFPSHPDRGYAFRGDGRYFVLAERHKLKDTVGVYDATDSYNLVRHFPLPTASMSSLALSPTGNHVAVWENVLEYRIYILSLAGELVGAFSPDPDPGFGIRSVAWHPSGFFLGLAGWDDKVYILESLTWSPIVIFELQSRFPSGVTIWREPNDWLEQTHGRGFISYERVNPPHSLPLPRPDYTKASPKSGVIQMSFNVTGTILLVRFESAPTAVFLYTFPSLPESPSDCPPGADPPKAPPPRLRSVLLHGKAVMNAKWNPVRKGSLVVCTGSGSMYLWSDEWIGEAGDSEEVAECVGVPAAAFDTRDIRWSPDGKGMILLDKDMFCCAFEVEERDDVVPV